MNFARTRDVKAPTYAYDGSAGLDFFVPNDILPTLIQPNCSALIPSGIRARIKKGHAMIAFNKSGVATKKGLIVGACVVDCDYQGEIHLHVMNVTNVVVKIEPGEKLVQFVTLPYVNSGLLETSTDDLFEETTRRAEGGFGSSGVV